MLLRAARDAAQNHVRLEEQAALDRERPAPAQASACSRGAARAGPRSPRRQGLRSAGGGSRGRHPQASPAEARRRLPVRARRPAMCVRRCAGRAGRSHRGAGRTRPRARVASSTPSASTRTSSRSGTLPSGRRSDVTAGTSATTTPGLDEQAKLEPELRALRRRHERPFPELLRQDDRDDLVAVRAARRSSPAPPSSVAAHRLHLEPRLAAGQVEPARADPGVGVLPGTCRPREVAAADPARVPDGPFGRDVDGLDVHENAHAANVSTTETAGTERSRGSRAARRAGGA